MTDTTRPTTKPERFCVVDDTYLLPFDKAFELMTLLADAQKVASDYSGGYKTVPAGNDKLKCVVISASTYATLQLDRND